VISSLGLLSIIALLVSVGALLLHSRLLFLRGAVDDSFKELEELIHDRLQIIYDIASTLEDSQDLKERCIKYSGREVRQILKSMHKLHKAITAIPVDSELKDELTENSHEIERAVRAFNEVLVKYNRYVSKFPGRIVSFAVGLKPEKPINVNATH